MTTAQEDMVVNCIFTHADRRAGTFQTKWNRSTREYRVECCGCLLLGTVAAKYPCPSSELEIRANVIRETHAFAARRYQDEAQKRRDREKLAAAEAELEEAL